MTPEAPGLEAVFTGADARDIAPADLPSARAALSSGSDGPLDMVAIGTPHFSFSEFATLMALLAGRRARSGLAFLLSTSRFMRDLAAHEGWIAELQNAGVTVIVDTCTYFSPAVRGARGRVMTNAAKWAWYAPGMLGVEVCFGSLKECVESAIRGEVWRDPSLWSALEP